ncbi:Uncharacterised protein [Mycobacterium tuberculosis]|nr:Uncharacterised protein [Mycobacterium tuberculosis]STZ11552.1 Uncharacterised protein [Morganella morganii]
MFGYSEQLDNCCEALVAQGSPAELNQPLFFGQKKPVNIDRQKVS